MSTFWKVRLATMIWGFAISWLFTGQIGLASSMFLVMIIGNTVIMKVLIK